MSLNIINDKDIDDYVLSLCDTKAEDERRLYARVMATNELAQQATALRGGIFGAARQRTALPPLYDYDVAVETPRPRLIDRDQAWLCKAFKRHVYATGTGVITNSHIGQIGFFDTRTVTRDTSDALKHVVDWLEAMARLKPGDYPEYEGWQSFCRDTDKQQGKLQHLGFLDALNAANKWFVKRSRIETRARAADDSGDDVMNIGNGLRWVKLTTRSQYLFEGALMHHCVAGYYGLDRGTLYSLRDENNRPQLTAMFRDNGSLIEAKGLQNATPTAAQKQMCESLHKKLWPQVDASLRAELLAGRHRYTAFDMATPDAAFAFEQTNDGNAMIPGTQDAGVVLVIAIAFTAVAPVVGLIASRVF